MKIIYLALIFSLSNALFFNAFLNGTVSPIIGGESLWRISSRVGVTSDIILSKICELDTNCDVSIFQDDIAVGGVGGDMFEITGTGGIYCLAEGITFTVSPAIKISGSNIVLDLNGFVLDGQPFGGSQPACAILLKAGASNITIKNGTVSRTVNAICDEGLDNQLHNIVIEDMRFARGTGAAIAFDANTTIPDVDNILIQNCIFDRTRAANIQCETALVRNCAINGISTTAQAKGFFVSGLGIFTADSILFEDCTFVNFDDFSISMSNAKNGTIRHCVSSDRNSGVGVTVLCNSVDNVVITDYVFNDVLLISDVNLQIINALSIYIARCYGSRIIGTFLGIESGPRDLCGAEIIDCFALSAVAPAFEFLATGTSAFTNLKVSNCFAQNGPFSFGGDAGARFTNIVFENCVSVGNGFFLDSSFPAMEHAVFKDCIALESSFRFNSSGVVRDIIFDKCLAVSDRNVVTDPTIVNAFELGATTTLGKVINCYALAYTNTGFVNNAPTSANYFFGNTGVASSVNYGGSGSVDPVLLNDGAEAIAGGTPWTNASMP